MLFLSLLSDNDHVTIVAVNDVAMNGIIFIYVMKIHSCSRPTAQFHVPLLLRGEAGEPHHQVACCVSDFFVGKMPVKWAIISVNDDDSRDLYASF